MITLMKIFGMFDMNNGTDLFFVIFLIVVGLALLVFFILLIANGIPHTCERCLRNKTTYKNDDGEYQCEECTNALLIKDAKKKEKIRICPDCGKDMDKQVIDGTDIVADVCPSCNGMFLDKGELEELEDQLGIEEITFSPATSVVVMSNILH